MIYDFKVNILRNNNSIGTIKTRKCDIFFNSNAEVKRGMRISVFKDSYTIRTDSNSNNETEFNMFSDRLQPVLILNGKEYPLGVFMIVSNPELISDTYNYYDLQAYDETMILKQGALEERLYYAEGTKYIDIISELLTRNGFANVLIDKSEYILTTEREFAVGENYISIINTLLNEINYREVYADQNGYINIVKRQNPTIPKFIYRDKHIFNLHKPIKLTNDIYSLPNVLIGVASNPDIKDVLMYKKVNNDLESSISVINRGYKVVKKYNLGNVASFDVLKDYVDYMYLQSTQSTEIIEFESSIEPNHNLEDYIQLDTSLIEGFFVEKEWSMSLDVKASMKHKAERKVFV